MGIVNVTPDSFSDGGRFEAAEDAIAEGLRQREQGASIVDVGGESTRPGAAPVTADEEIRRVLPVIEALAADGVAVSADTSKPEVARAALDAGAVVINDVTGFRDPAMIEVCAGSDAGVVVMHMLGDPRTMQDDPTYDDVVEDVTAYLAGRLDELAAAGLGNDRIAIDPGIGFGKTLDHNLQLLAAIDRLDELGAPVMIGTSRKSFLGKLTGRASDDRDVVSAVSVAHAILSGASIVRVHNVPFAADAAAFADAMVRFER